MFWLSLRTVHYTFSLPSQKWVFVQGKNYLQQATRHYVTTWKLSIDHIFRFRLWTRNGGTNPPLHKSQDRSILLESLQIRALSKIERRTKRTRDRWDLPFRSIRSPRSRAKHNSSFYTKSVGESVHKTEYDIFFGAMIMAASSRRWN